MPNDDSVRNSPASDKLTLGLLRVVGQDGRAGQRAMARDLGVAVGLVNAYVKRCVAKGWLKVSQVHSSTVSYMLTPKGFLEKARLTSEYLSQSFSLFRDARQQYEELFDLCRARGWTRIVLYGHSEMTDVALLCAKAAGIEPMALVDPGANRDQYLGVPCLSALPATQTMDALIVTAMWKLPEVFDQLQDAAPDDRVLVPAMLRHLRRRAEPGTPS